jgi:hypothetical protein
MSSTSKRLARHTCLYVLATLCLATAVVGAQEPDARLRVTVVDQTAGRIPEATVTVNGTEGQRAAEESRTAGVFLVSLRSGKYSVAATAAGFAPGSVDVELTPNGLTEVSIQLHLVVTEKVTVEGLRLQSLKGRILTAEDLKLLPNNETEMRYMLLELAGSRGRPGDIAIYVDGFSDFRRLPPRAAIELIQINAEPYSAEFAEPGTRRIEIITKPGSEGTFRELKSDFNDETLNATDAFATGKPALQRRSFSSYYSAPIIPNKWGFYAYAGRWEQDENAVINATVLNNLSQPVPFSAALGAPFRENNLTLNSGYALGTQVRLMTEYSRNTTAGENQGLRSGGFRLPDQAYELDNVANIGRLSLLSVLGPTTVHELRVRVADERNTSRAVSNHQAVMVLDSFMSGGNQESRLNDQSNAKLQVDTKLTRSFGRHTLNTGVQLDRLGRTVVNAADFGGTFIFGADTLRDENGVPIGNGDSQLGEITPLENYVRTLTGAPGAAPTMFTITRGDPRAALAQWEFAAYAQSDWRPSDHLTLSYGLRYEAQTNLNDRLNLAPRFGFAWSPGGDKGLIRAGAGVFYDRVDLSLTLDPLRLEKLQRFVVPRPNFFFVGPPGELGAAADQTLLRKSEDLLAPRRLMSNVSYERELAWKPFKSSLFGAVGYTWEHASRLPRLLDTNAPLLPESPRPNAEAGQLLLYDSVGRSARRELQLSLRAGFNAGSRIYTNYSLSSTRGDADSPLELPASSYNLAAEYGAAQTHERHRFFISGNVVLPRSWMLVPSFTASSGRPFNILTGLDNNSDGHLTDRPGFADAAADPDAIRTPWGLLDPTPEPGESVIPRNFGRGTAQYKFDMMIMKTVMLGKAQAHRILAVSMNVENLFNTANLRDFNGVLVSPVFGQANTAQPARRASLGFVINF